MERGGKPAGGGWYSLPLAYTAGGLLVGLLTLVIPQVMGVGYETVEAMQTNCRWWTVRNRDAFSVSCDNRMSSPATTVKFL